MAEKLPLGVIVHLRDDPLEPFQKVKELGFPTCQLYSPPEDYLGGKKNPQFKEALERTGVKVTSVFIGFEGQVWNLVDGPSTIGFVPLKTRAARVAHARRISDWVRDVGLDSVTSHVGFIPEDPSDPIYPELIRTLEEYIGYCKANSQGFRFETGQETPQTLRRAIEDIGMGNVGINLDPANLLMYGKAKPLEALNIIGKYVLATHCKDGKWPTEPGKLGKECPMGEGDVDFPRLIPRLKSMGYKGPLTIEREISGDQQIKDILRAKEILDKLR